MICIAKNKEGTEILLSYAAGNLDRERTAELDQHIRDCAECRRLTEAQRLVFSALEEWTGPDVSADFDRKLYARIAAERPSIWQRIWKPVVPVTLAAAVLSLMLIMRDPDSGPANKQSGMEKTDIEHVEQVLDDIEMLQPASTPM